MDLIPPQSKFRSLLRPVKPPIAWLLSRHSVRKLLTANFTSGWVAFGEKNEYLIPARWTTLDISGADFECDLRSGDPLPLPSSSQKGAYTSHCIEHLDEASLRFLMQEAYRILKPGGGIRVEAPDAELLYQAYKEGDETLFQSFQQGNAQLAKKRGYPPILGAKHSAFLGLTSCYIEDGAHVPVEVESNIFHEKLSSLSMEDFFTWCVSLQTPEQFRSGGHINPIYWSKMFALLTQVGFRLVIRQRPSETQIPGLRLRGIERLNRSFYSLYIEAIK